MYVWRYMIHQQGRMAQLIPKVIAATLAVMVMHGIITTSFIITPFWIDEWRVIYNLKFKNASELWGQLYYLQQFPRLYLSVVKVFTEAFDYSYTALRIPSLVVGTLAMLLAWRLMRRIYLKDDWLQYLLVIVVVSSPAFTRYFVQIKQYTMDIMLSLVALWQVLELLRVAREGGGSGGRYLLLCVSLVVAPFFSYTYPICILPAYVVVAIICFQRRDKLGFPQLVSLWLPLVLLTISVAVFYFVDVAQLLADQGMQTYWQYNLPDALDASGILLNLFAAFQLPGTGYVFAMLFGLLGTAGFVIGFVQSFNTVKKGSATIRDMVVVYSVAVVLTAFLLFLLDKLPLGESRLNAFLIVFETILVINLLKTISDQRWGRGVALVVGLLLYAGVTGNIYTTLVHVYFNPDRDKTLDVYHTTANAINLAREQDLPIIVTPGVAYPYEDDQNYPFDTKVPGDWVLKTHPAYKVRDRIIVYPIWNIGQLSAAMDSLPPQIAGAVLTDGIVAEVRKK